MKFKREIRTIFLDKESPRFEVDEKVNVILSPSLYWIKRVSLPVKYARDAKKLLPSIFDDILDDGNYNYSVYKEEDEFVAFAYDDKVILDTLEEKGISASNVAKVYFAQSELGFIEGALKINETQSVFLKDSILILLPCCWIEESGELNLDDVVLSKHSISLAQFGHIIDNKSIYKIAAVLFMLIILVSVELFITHKKVDEIVALKETLFKKAKLQSTMFQNKAQLKKYKSTYTRQVALRSDFAGILSLKLQKEESLKLITYKKKTLSVEFTPLSTNTIKKISKILKAKGLKYKSKAKEKSWHLEMKI